MTILKNWKTILFFIYFYYFYIELFFSCGVVFLYCNCRKKRTFFVFSSLFVNNYFKVSCSSFSILSIAVECFILSFLLWKVYKSVFHYWNIVEANTFKSFCLIQKLVFNPNFVFSKISFLCSSACVYRYGKKITKFRRNKYVWKCG